MNYLKGIKRRNKHHVQYHDVPSTIRPIPHSSDFAVPDPDCYMEYSSDLKNSDMTVVGEDGAVVRRGRLASTLDTSKTQWPKTRTERFKGICSAAGFTSQKEIYIGTWNNVLLVQGPRPRICHLVIAKIFLDWLDQWDLRVMQRNGDFWLTHPTEVSKKVFYIMGIVFHPSLQGIQDKWKKLIAAWTIRSPLLTTRNTNSWSVEILKWLDWSYGLKMGTQRFLLLCVSGIAGLTTNIISEKNDRYDEG